MLLFTRKPFDLKCIQVYAQGAQFIFQDGLHQPIVFSSIRPVHLAQTGIFSS